MSHTPRHREVRKHRALRAVAISVAAVLVVALTAGFFVYRHLEGNITTLDIEDALGTDRPEKVIKEQEPHQPLNILLLGSDTREGQGNHIGGETPGLSDTTILLNISADRDRAYGVSLPRDAMVERPPCVRKDGQGMDAGGLSMFNAAYAVGGPACTVKTVEQLTDIRIDHFVVVDFNGFKHMVDALGGVPVCVPEEVNDTIGNIYLPAGSYEVQGQQALNYVRLRHGLSENGDIGRMKRQQAFLASMANKAISAGTLANPVRLYNFLDAATKSLTTDPGLDNLRDLAGLAKQLKDIGLDNIQFLTVPFESYEPDPNRLVWAPEAEQLWDKIRHDEPLTGELSQTVTTAAEDPDGESGRPTDGPSTGATDSPSASPSDAETRSEAEVRAANGLCT
ncbi:MAG TPA: LCP family protein [Pseudonocardiaceae bacterium]|nr:LCP family protein [Pseudonocardiaceae bacterium]